MSNVRGSTASSKVGSSVNHNDTNAGQDLNELAALLAGMRRQLDQLVEDFDYAIDGNGGIMVRPTAQKAVEETKSKTYAAALETHRMLGHMEDHIANLRRALRGPGEPPSSADTRVAEAAE